MRALIAHLNTAPAPRGGLDSDTGKGSDRGGAEVGEDRIEAGRFDKGRRDVDCNSFQ